MNFNFTKVSSIRRKNKLFLIMKILVFLSFTVTFAFTGNSGFSQNTKIVIEKNIQVSVEQVFEIIKNQTDYNFAYKSDIFKTIPEVILEKGKISIKDLLQKSLDPFYDYQFDDINNSIIIVPHKIKDKQPQEDHLVKGVVTDKNGFPLFGATVSIVNKNKGVFTDEDGSYKLMALNSDVLKFTYIGYKSKEVVVGNQQEINVDLDEAVSKLDEVQITAYGKTSKRIATGNITTITSEEIRKNPVANVLQALKGKVPGVYIRQLTGQANSPFDIEIRGKNTLSLNSSPLLVIDGVAFPTGNLPQISKTWSAVNGGSGLNYIDPNDIESINFLKDADVTAVYGSRGSNGVILITTKKGKSGKPTLSVSSKNGLSFRGKSPKLLETKDYISYRKEAIENAGDLVDFYDDVNGVWSEDNNTDWEKFFFGSPALTTNNRISYSGGDNRFSYLLSGSYRNEENILNISGANKIGSIHFNFNTNSSDNKFSVGLTGTYTATKNTAIQFSESTLIAPNSPNPYNEDGSLDWTYYNAFNPRNPAAIFNAISEDKVDNLVSNLSLKYVFFKGVTFNTNLGVSILSSNEFYGLPSTYYGPDSYQENSSTINTYKIRTITAEPNISYETSLSDLGNITLKVGGTIQDGFQTNTNFTGYDLLSDEQIRNPTFADTGNLGAIYSTFTNRYIGFFGILNYNLANKYILNGSLRHDGSTKFGTGNRFGTFGSIAGAWIVSEEQWFKNHVSFINYAKVRASYGTSGGDGIPNYQYLTKYTTSYKYNNETSLVPSGPANPLLHWENNKKSEVSISLEFFKGRVSFSDSYYSTISNDQLTLFPSSIVTGVPALYRNSPATIKNWGHEIMLSTQNIQGRNFNWTTDITLTLPKNKLVSYPNSEISQDINFEVGKPITGIKLYSYQGVNPETGNYNFWRDLDNNGIINDGEVDEWTYDLYQVKDRTEFVDLSPKYYGGVQNSFSYKNINFSFFFSFTKKTGLNFIGSQVDTPGGFNVNITKDIYDARWQNPGDITNVAKLSSDFSSFSNHLNFQSSTGAYSDATFARLENVSLSYELPKEFIKKLNLKSLQFYVQGQNLFTISKYKGYDPETLGEGVAPLRTIVLGFDLSL